MQGHGDARGELVYFAFDLLHLDGEDLMRLPSARTQGASRSVA
jgi:ATP-dependent DNA ligase